MSTESTITKSQYMNGCRHPAWVWLEKHNPSAIPSPDAVAQATFAAGQRYESYVEQLFIDGENAVMRDIPAERVRQVMGREAQVLFQAEFASNGFSCISDIVVWAGDDTVDIYEVKASTRVKPEHELDLAFQKAVIEAAGLTVRDAYVVHVNNKYQRQGDIDVENLSVVECVTAAVERRRDETIEGMSQVRAIVESDTMPDADPQLAKLGSRTAWQKIYDNLFPQAEKTFDHTPEATVDRVQLKRFIEQLQYPLYFLDYETMQDVIPRFDGHRPYQQIPFQYSIHVLRQPGGEVEHYEYIHAENSDPSLPLAEQLVRDLGNNGSVVTWNMAFEKSRNSELADMYPQLAEPLGAINSRVVDLMIPFKNKWYDDLRFEGSASIKKVLPVLCEHLSYKTLGIQDGNTAQLQWMASVLDGQSAEERGQVIADLAEYCKLDTWAMVEILRVLETTIADDR